jgi:hypothetical protein
MLRGTNFRFSPAAREAFVAYIAARMKQPLFSNARSIRNALGRARLRQANRLMGDLDRDLDAEDLMTLDAPDITASRVFRMAGEQARSFSAGDGPPEGAKREPAGPPRAPSSADRARDGAAV